MTTNFTPAYLQLLESGELDKRVEEALSHLSSCDLCPRECGVDRSIGSLGQCQTSRKARISSFFPHRGEEYPLRGIYGSGTIFVGYCNLRCQYCQNHDISQEKSGKACEAEEIAVMMLTLQSNGCHNINIVSPSHVVAQMIEAIAVAAKNGLKIPIVYNTGGYDAMTSLKLLDGIVDIYMPDMKYSDDGIGYQFSQVENYSQHNQAAVKEMHRQVGDLKVDDRGIATRGLLIRHLVLPGGLAGSEKTMRFLANEISKDTYINIMDQYRPEYKARSENIKPLNRRPTKKDINEVYEIARSVGLHRFDQHIPTVRLF